MKIHASAVVPRLEDLPNIGKSIAADLRSIGIKNPAELAEVPPLQVYTRLSEPMGKRHDPCVLHTLLSVRHFQKTGEKMPWWKFTEEGRGMISGNRSRVHDPSFLA